MKKKILLLALMASVFSCALQMWKVETNKLVPYPDFTRFTVWQGSSRPVVISDFIDNREVKDKIGIVKTGVKYRETPVYMDNDITLYLKDYWPVELKKRGIQIVDTLAQYELTITLEKLWVSEKADKSVEQAECEVNYSFSLAPTDKKLPAWEGKVSSKFTSPGDSNDATRKIAPTLATCFATVVEKLVNDPKFKKTLTF